MSTYYDFFAARITDEDMIEAIGPYIRSGEEYRLVPIVSRSRSFIHWDEFGAWALPVSRIPEHQQEIFTDEGWNDDERHSIAYFITYDEVASMAGDGLIRGYVTLDELDAVTRSNYDPDTFWDLWVRSPETIAEMDAEMRKQYGHIAFIDRFSTEYICRQLIDAVDPIEYSIERSKLCFIVRVC